ncbi:contractile injection system tape measure protein [Nostoc linckia]|uniref:contractile injection system tape measure protein n=1 Tax=Nostoc linckia TaxID=92942 RepID=UPI000BFFC5E9|nr:contractile injection system tape measure protein [Nostoc linckia]
MSQQQHSIKKQIIEINLSSQTDAFELQNEISRIYHHKFIPLIDNLLSQFSSSEIIYQINQLEIDLGNIDIHHLEEELVDKFIEKFQEKLPQAIGVSTYNFSQQTRPDIKLAESSILPVEIAGLLDETAKERDNNRNKNQLKSEDKKTISKNILVEITDIEASDLNILNYFMQTGMLPWWSEKFSKQELEECCDRLLTNSPNKIKYLVEQSIKEPKQLQRLIYQFSDSILLKIAGLLTADADLVQFIANYNTDTKLIFQQLKQTKNIPEAKLRLTKWQGIFFTLSSNSNIPLNKFRFTQANLLHITTSCGINYSEFLNSLIAQINYSIRDGKYSKGTLAQILTEIKIPNENTQINLLSSELQQLSLNTQISPQYTQQINQLNNEFQRLLNEIKNSAENQSHQRTRLNQLEKVTQSLKIKIQQDINSQQFTLANTNNTFSQSEEIYIFNAGLILLWPFLNRLFTKIRLVKKNYFINKISAERASLLLQYLVDGSTNSSEYMFPLNKILCGLDLLEPLNTNLEITTEEHAESENLLSAVIQNWSILKNTSMEGLRKAFLHRNGILRVHHDGWLLQVERQTYDVLLDKIPWSIQVIKLPWMNNILHVEW